MNINASSLNFFFDSAIKNHQKNNFEEAEKLYKKVLEINSSHFFSIFHLASLFALKKQLVKAEEYLNKAITIRPNYVSAHNNLGGILLEQGKYYESLLSFQRATELDPKHINARNNLSILLRSTQINSISQKENIKNLFLFLFKRNDVNHAEIFRNAKSTLITEVKYKELSKILASHKPLLENSIIQSLLKEQLFHLMLQKTICEDDFLENMLTRIRSEILINIMHSKKNILKSNLKFIISLSEQCFFNEYVFFQTSEEINYINILKNKLEKKNKIDELEVAVLGSYIPLFSQLTLKKKLITHVSDEVLFDDLIVMQIKEPNEEKKIKNTIKSLSIISDDVSVKVKNQYEENPYPRWRYTYDQLPTPFLARLGQQIRPNKIKVENRFTNPNVLIAGCGTGHHVCIAKDYLNSKVLAVDLSLSSLSYAKRKTDELNFKNIEYLNADILELDLLKRKFDVIECIGVLHHMENPLKGLKILLNILEPHGLMKIGLYSEKAREHIVGIRKFIREKKYKNNISDIRECRKEILNKKENNIFKKIVNRSDFYSTSNARDLMFHVQEHRFTLSQIAKIISDLNIDFLGFTNEHAKKKYSQFFPEDDKNVSLNNWNKFEIDFPDTFVSMYNFWLRKK
jgi:ubiquinone/menaquinone biosynthesis C-methylase UbiE